VDATVLLLTLAYMVIAALLLNLNLATRYNSWIKGAVIVFTTGLYAGTWYGYKGMTGWASTVSLPETFRVLWINIDEPLKSGDKPGYIFYWVRQLDEAGLPVGSPRAHRVDWDEASAEAAENVLSALESGEQRNGRLSRSLIVHEENEAEVELADQGEEQSVSGVGGGVVSIEFLEVPPRTLPAKPTP
jgi:hypothetical protein